MEISFGEGKTEYGPGVQINLTGNEVTYLTAHNVHIFGPATITVNGELCKIGSVYVDPSGRVVSDGIGWNGKGNKY